MVQSVESIQPELNPGAFAEPEALRQRCIKGVDRRAIEEVASGFKPKAADSRRGKRRDVELLVRIAASTGTRITDDRDTATLVLLGSRYAIGCVPQARNAELHIVGC